MSSEARPVLRRLGPEDAAALCSFYNALDEGSKRLFRPLGEKTNEERCRSIAEENLPGKDTKFDMIALYGERVVGWAFLWHDHGKIEEATLGIGLAEDEQGKGLGGRLMEYLMQAAPRRDLRKIDLTVIRGNVIAQHVYEKHGFVRKGQFVAEDGRYYSMGKEIAQ